MIVRVVVDSRVRLADPVDEETECALAEAFTHSNPKHYALRAMGKSTYAQPPTIPTWRRGDDGLLHFPRGGLRTLREVLAEAGHVPRFRDARAPGDLAQGATIPEHRIPVAPYRLWDHQRDALAAILARESCLIRAGTGSGKTSTVLAAIGAAKTPAVVIVWSTKLFEQWVKRVVLELRIPYASVGRIAEGKEVIRPVTIAMQQTLNARGVREEWKRYFGFVALDESQRSPATSVYGAVDPWPARYRVAVSADHSRKDHMEFLTYGLFGEVAHEVTRKELIAAGHVHDVEVRIVPTKFRAPWYRGTADGANFFLDLDTPARGDFNKLCEQLAADPEREAIIDRIVADELLAGSSVVVLSHRREHCEKIRDRLVARGIGAGLLLGSKENAAEFAATAEGLATGKLTVGVGTYQAFGTGVDLPSLGAVVCVTPIAGNKQFFGQVWGRACRVSKGKRGAQLYYLLDTTVFDQHRRNLLAWNDSVTEWDGRRWAPAKRHP